MEGVQNQARGTGSILNQNGDEWKDWLREFEEIFTAESQKSEMTDLGKEDRNSPSRSFGTFPKVLLVSGVVIVGLAVIVGLLVTESRPYVRVLPYEL